jgi:hypothetical protein
MARQGEISLHRHPTTAVGLEAEAIGEQFAELIAGVSAGARRRRAQAIKLKKTFESMGLEFIGTVDSGAGVRWMPKK